MHLSIQTNCFQDEEPVLIYALKKQMDSLSIALIESSKNVDVVGKVCD